MFEEINYNRRSFLGTAAMSIAAAEFVMIGSASAQPSKINPAMAGGVIPNAGHNLPQEDPAGNSRQSTSARSGLIRSCL